MKVLKTNNQVILANNNAIVGEQDVVEEKDINFYDYDGTLLYSWTLDELPNKTELPPNPTHEGLTAQGWNWTLQSLITENAKMDVGQNYITDDGNTRIHINIPNNTPSSARNISIYFKQNTTNAVIINWGDGSATTTVEGTGYVNTSHQYNSNGKYTISLGGQLVAIGNDSKNVFGSAGEYNDVGNLQSTFIEKIELGNCNIIRNSIAYMYNLKTITIPNFYNGSLLVFCYNCPSLKALILPKTTTSLYILSITNVYNLKVLSFSMNFNQLGGSSIQQASITKVRIPKNIITPTSGNLFYECKFLKEINYPNLTTIYGGMYRAMYSLPTITIPSTCTTIQNIAIYQCLGLQEIHFESSTPPTLLASASIYQLPPSCTIYVPTGSLSAYTTATNYPDPSVYTYVEE